MKRSPADLLRGHTPAVALAFLLAACASSSSTPPGDQERDAAVPAADARSVPKDAAKGGTAGAAGAGQGTDVGAGGMGGASGGQAGGAGSGEPARTDGGAGTGVRSDAGPPPTGNDAADAGGTVAKGPLKVFLDTDLVVDSGDMGAVAFLHGLADRCEIEIVGITAATTDDAAAGCLDATNRYFGRPDLPIGVLKGSSFLENDSAYSKTVRDRFPNKYKTANDAPDATAQFRKVIASQPDASVVLVAIGPLRNIRNFLESKADNASPLSGRELIAKKVVQLVAMGGDFMHSNPEYNIQKDPAAANAVAAGWPTPLVFAGYDLGTGWDPDPPHVAEQKNSPVTLALCTDGCHRPGWDQSAILYAVRSKQPLWKNARTYGSVSFDNEGRARWSATPDKHQGVVDDSVDNESKLIGDIEAAAGRMGDCRVPGAPAAK